ncbi:hypothetical protein AB833_22700 [Chromatiales bacterium (ex Bugula neritina AB1)]|nr:hypothetical protein AB833_22700 [Chromatiales bacterium (ex Bugula neritina AB1)]
MTTLDTQRTLGDGDYIQWYRVKRVLGRGGFGITYLATDTNLDHHVAIKEYRPGAAVIRAADNSLQPANSESTHDYHKGLQRFLREARTLVKFRHPNIVRVMAVFEANNTAYLVMEYEEGQQFKQFVKGNNGIAEAELTTLILKVVDGLDQVHQHGFIHRDIKPVNLIIRRDGSPVLLDFGSARPAGIDLADNNHTSFVSAGYTPLEQYQEGAGLAVGPWTDIYALGGTLYYAISGQSPVSPVSRLAALVKKSPDPLRPAVEVGAGHYSKQFLRAIDWALGFKIEDRPQSLLQWRTALDECVQLSAHGAIVEKSPSGGVRPELENTPQRASRLLVDKSLQRRSTLDPRVGTRRRSVAGLFSLVLAGAAIAGSSIWVYSAFKEKREVQQLLLRASEAVESTAVFESAVPLYQQILKVQPENQQALQKLREIATRARGSVEASLDAGRLQQATWELRQLRSLDLEAATDLQSRLQLARQKISDDASLAAVERFLRAGKLGDAEAELDRRRAQIFNPDSVAVLETAIRDAREAAARRAEKQAESDRKNQLNRELVAAASARQRQRRSQYAEYLIKAEKSLLEHDLTAAREWLNNAISLQISDHELADIETRVVAAENFQREPLSRYEIRYAAGRFNSLKRAVETKNLQAIGGLTDGSPSRLEFFRILFDRYARLKGNVIEVEPMLDPKRVTATLRIEELDLPNGDIVYPSPSYRDTKLSLLRTQRGWSKIQW